MKKVLFDSRFPRSPNRRLVFSGTDAERLCTSGPMSGRTANAEPLEPLLSLLDPESSEWTVRNA